MKKLVVKKEALYAVDVLSNTVVVTKKFLENARDIKSEEFELYTEGQAIHFHSYSSGVHGGLRPVFYRLYSLQKHSYCRKARYKFNSLHILNPVLHFRKEGIHSRCQGICTRPQAS